MDWLYNMESNMVYKLIQVLPNQCSLKRETPRKCPVCQCHISTINFPIFTYAHNTNSPLITKKVRQTSYHSYAILKLLQYTDCQQLIPQMISNRHISHTLECDYRFIAMTNYLHARIKKLRYSSNSYAIINICKVHS